MGHPTVIRFDTLAWGNYIGSINHFFRADFDGIEETSLGQGPEGPMKRIELTPDEFIKHIKGRINTSDHYGQRTYFQTQIDVLKRLK